MPEALSIVIPVRDEQASIAALAAEIEVAMAGLSWEAIWVDDGSRDASLAAIRALGPPHRALALDGPRGQSAALAAGFRAARGAWIGTLDGDGQNDPADLPILLEIARARGVDMVNGYRADRADTAIRRAASRIANGARSIALGRDVRDVGCSTRVTRREALLDVPLFDGMHRFLPSLVKARGYRLAEVPVRHRPRARGASKYGIRDRLFRGLADLAGARWLLSRMTPWRADER